MKGTYTTLYFSKKYDADLLELYKQIGRKDFIKIMKECLRMLVRPGWDPPILKELHLYPGSSTLTRAKDEREYSGDGATKDESIPLVVSFSSVKDRDVLELLRRVVKGKLGLFVKNAMRMAIGPYFMLGCMLNGGDDRMNLAYKDKGMFFVQGIAVAEGAYEVRESKPSKNKQTNAKNNAVHEQKTAEQRADSREDVTEAARRVGSTPSFSPSAKTTTNTPSQQEASRDNHLHTDDDVSKEQHHLEEKTTSEELVEIEIEGTGELSDDDILSLLENM